MALVMENLTEDPTSTEKPVEVKDYRKVLLVYNPFSGNGVFASHLDHIIDRFQDAGCVVRPVRGAKSKALEYVFQTIHTEDYRQVIIAGGDGTINLVVNLMIKYNIELPISIFPAGTANDFAYYLEIPSNIDEMIDIALGDKYTYADVACCNGRYYVNVAAMGTMVDVSQKTDPNLKDKLGVLAYYMTGAQEITNLKPLPVRLIADNDVFDEDMYFMLVMNGCSAGGFKHLSPDSDISDGLLDVLLFREMPFYDMVRLFFMLLQGQHKDDKNVLHFKTSNLVIESEATFGTDVDGETGEKLPLHFSVLHRRLKITTKENDI